MAEHLYLRLGLSDPEPYIEWMMLDETSGVVRFRGEGDALTLAELIADLDLSGEVIVMLHGEDLLLTRATIPSRQQRQILQAVPFMVEESLATEIEDCHFAIGPRDSDGSVSVGIISLARMQACMALMAELNLQPTICTVDTLQVPGRQAAGIMIDGGRALVRTGGLAGFCTTPDMLALMIDLLDEEAKTSVEVFVGSDAHEAIGLLTSQIQAEQDIEVQVTPLEYSPFETLCRNFRSDSINLLQGEFKIAKPRQQQRTSWRAVAVLAACAFALHLTVIMGQGVYLDVKANQVESEVRALYAEVHPADRNVADIRRRWQGHLSGGGGASGGFMALFHEAARNLPGSSLQLDNVNFNESRGDLVMQLQTARSEQLIEFSETLNKLGLDSEIGTINQGDDAVRGSVKVKSVGGR